MNRVSPTLALLLLGGVAAQAPLYPLPTRGIYSSYSAGLVFDDDPSIIGKKQPGLPARIDLFTSGRPGVAHYSGARIDHRLAALSNGAWVLSIQLDAMSTGNDLLPLYMNPVGDFCIYQGNTSGWATLCVAVRPDPLLGGDDGIFGYYFDNPSFPAQLRNGVYHEVLPGEFVSGAVQVSGESQVVAMDIAMGLIDAAGGQPVLGVNFELARLYFSVTPWCAQMMSVLVPSLQFDAGQGASAPYTPPGGANADRYTGATVFVAEFDPQTGDCIDVKVHADYEMFELDPHEDIDALALTRLTSPIVPPANGTQLQNGTFQYVLSTAVTSGTQQTSEPEELFVVATPQGGARKKGRFRTGADDILVGGGGTLLGQVHGVCGDDPEAPGSGGIAGAQPHDHGSGDDSQFLGLSVHATTMDASEEGLEVDDMFQLKGIVSGWAGDVVEPSLVVVVVELLGLSLQPDDVTMQHLIMPVRMEGDDIFEFTLDYALPWTLANNTNWLQIHAYQVRLSDFGVTESIRVRLHRG